MRAAGRDEIRLEPDRVEDRVGRKARGDVGAGRRSRRGCGRARRRPRRPSPGRSRRRAAAPSRPGTGRAAARPSRTRPPPRSSPRIAGTAAGTIAAGDPHPLDLVAVALDRRLPVRGDLELRQRALDADDAGRQVDAVDVRRDAAGQRHEREPVGERSLSPFARSASSSAVSRSAAAGGRARAADVIARKCGAVRYLHATCVPAISDRRQCLDRRRMPATRQREAASMIRYGFNIKTAPASGSRTSSSWPRRRTTPSAACGRCTTTARSSSAASKRSRARRRHARRRRRHRPDQRQGRRQFSTSRHPLARRSSAA